MREITIGAIIGLSVSIGSGIVLFLLQSMIKSIQADRQVWKELRIELDSILSRNRNKFYLDNCEKSNLYSKEFRDIGAKIKAHNKMYRSRIYRLLLGVNGQGKVLYSTMRLTELSNLVGQDNLESKSKDINDCYENIRQNLRIEDVKLKLPKDAK